MRPLIKAVHDQDFGLPRDYAIEASVQAARIAAPSRELRKPKAGAAAAVAPKKPQKTDGAWSAAILLLSLVTIGMAAIGFREKIVRAAPALAPAYAGLGLPVNLLGLELRSVRSQIAQDGDRKLLTIEGEIVNLRRDQNRVPPVALTVRGANGQAKYAWTTSAPKTRLDGGETIAFRARLASPP